MFKRKLEAFQYNICLAITGAIRGTSRVYTHYQSLKNFSEDQLVNVLLFGSENVIFDTNVNVLRRTIEFLRVAGHFKGNAQFVQNTTFGL